MTYQPDKQQKTVLVNVATKGSAAPVGNFALDKITEDFVQTEATKFFARVASEAGPLWVNRGLWPMSALLPLCPG